MRARVGLDLRVIRPVTRAGSAFSSGSFASLVIQAGERSRTRPRGVGDRHADGPARHRLGGRGERHPATGLPARRVRGRHRHGRGRARARAADPGPARSGRPSFAARNGAALADQGARLARGRILFFTEGTSTATGRSASTRSSGWATVRSAGPERSPASGSRSHRGAIASRSTPSPSARAAPSPSAGTAGLSPRSGGGTATSRSKWRPLPTHAPPTQSSSWPSPCAAATRRRASAAGSACRSSGCGRYRPRRLPSPG